MLNLADWKEGLSQLLGGFAMEVQNLIRQLPTMGQADAEQKLEECGKGLAEGSQGLSKAKATYGELVEVFLKKFPPTFSEDLENNLTEYSKLIIFSLRSDNKGLLLKWGITHPQSKNLSWMEDSEEKQKHINALAALRDVQPGADDEFNYLIHQLSQLPK